MNSLFTCDSLIAPQTLNDFMSNGKAGLTLIDCSYALAHMNIDVRDLYTRHRIGEAVFFDIDAIAAPESPLPHMMPDAAQFERQMQELGLNQDDVIVLYHNEGIPYACARAWWMLRAFGHERVCLLDGGLKGWEAAGFPLNDGTPPNVKKPGDFKAAERPILLHNKEDIQAHLDGSAMTLLDARGASRFCGEEAEPRPGLNCGHVPGAVNIPFTALIDPETGLFKSRAALQDIFSAYELGAPITAMCGSGVTACILAFGLFLSGHENVHIYDGSWAEWGDPALALPCATA